MWQWNLLLDTDPAKASSTTNSAYEMMVWIGEFGGVRPIGFTKGVKAERKIPSGNL